MPPASGPCGPILPAPALSLSFHSLGSSHLAGPQRGSEENEACELLLLLSPFSPVGLCAIPQTAAHQAPLSLGLSRQEHWSGLPCPSPEARVDGITGEEWVRSQEQTQPARPSYIWAVATGEVLGRGAPSRAPNADSMQAAAAPAICLHPDQQREKQPPNTAHDTQ